MIKTYKEYILCNVWCVLMYHQEPCVAGTVVIAWLLEFGKGCKQSIEWVVRPL